MKTLIFTFLFMASPVLADQLIPDGNGGYRYFSNDGQSTVVIPTNTGGWNTYGSNGQNDQIIQNGNGGYNVYQNNPPVYQPPQPAYQNLYQPVQNQNGDTE